MAFIVYFHKDEEQGRMPLEGPIQIGRSPECEISIRDILLSRHHCRIEPANGGWVITDLGSKNGTAIGGNLVTRQNLEDGDVIRMGKTTLRFFAGEFVLAKTKPKSLVQRPADPFEALSGTISDFEYKPRGPVRKTDHLPVPQPGPQEPASFKSENVRGLVSEMVSSSWDSIYEEATRNEAEAPQSPLIEAVRKRRARDPHVDLALQVQPEKDRAAKLSPENDAPRPGVIETPKRVGPIRSLFRKLGMLFEVIAIVTLCQLIS